MIAENPVAVSVARFVEMVQKINDADLEREWVWGSYRSEGVRFSFFRCYEDLCELAVKLHQARMHSGRPISEAEYILTQYHCAYMDLQAVLLGVGQQYVDTAPTEGDWSVRETIAHILGADLGFYVSVKFALDRYRLGLNPLVPIEDETWLKTAGFEGTELDAIFAASFGELQAFHQDLHRKILQDFSGIQAEDMERLSLYWEQEPLSLRFRLHRFDSHLRQHAVQVEKTLLALGCNPGESQRLLRLIYFALAQVEGWMHPEGSNMESLVLDYSTRIEERNREIGEVLSR